MVRLGYKHSEATKRKIAESNRGKRRSAEQIKRISDAHLGQIGYWKGKKKGSMPTETREKIRLGNLGKHFNTPTRIGAKNNKWKGDDVGYSGVHDWIKYYYGLAKDGTCAQVDSTCKGRLEWTNRSGKYIRRITDWQVLCRSHHARYDKWWGKRIIINGRFA